MYIILCSLYAKLIKIIDMRAKRKRAGCFNRMGSKETKEVSGNWHSLLKRVKSAKWFWLHRKNIWENYLRIYTELKRRVIEWRKDQKRSIVSQETQHSVAGKACILREGVGMMQYAGSQCTTETSCSMTQLH